MTVTHVSSRSQFGQKANGTVHVFSDPSEKNEVSKCINADPHWAHLDGVALAERSSKSCSTRWRRAGMFSTLFAIQKRN